MVQDRKKANSPKAPVGLRLRITAAAEAHVRGGHPWVFAESIREQNRDGAAGELAVVYDRKNKFLAIGLFDPDSPIRVRVLHTGKPQGIDPVWWKRRLDAAVRRRDGLFDQCTTGYRLVNGESDGWPGLVLDRYDTTLVVKIYTAAWLPRLEEVTELIRERLRPERLVLRTSRNVRSVLETRGIPPHPGFLAQGERESWAVGSPSSECRMVRRFDDLTDGQILFGDRLEACPTFLESGLRFEADVLRGQKTGFFLDQRENRRMVETLAEGRTMLNVFSFSGGFSLYAARGRATSVTDLDISQHALEAAKRNFKLNQTEPAVARCQHELVKADAFGWLVEKSDRKFGFIVLDPPSLAKREAEREGAIRAYARLTELGIRHLSSGGILLACSCSAHVAADEFFQTVRQIAAKSDRHFTEFQITGHAPDHPATFKEAEYLKAIYLTLH